MQDDGTSTCCIIREQATGAGSKKRLLDYRSLELEKTDNKGQAANIGQKT